MRNYTKIATGVSVLAMSLALPAVAQETADGDELRQEKVVVTGSFIQGTPEDAALPVDVVGRGELDDIGAPSVNDILRNLPATQGLIGETNQFDTRGGQGNYGISTINLRGLGSARSLVLFNGHRQAAEATTGVDVNLLPSTAVGSIEVLKDGAAALYGSDAIGGVVNFRTRSDFEGVELRGSHKFIDGSDGDSEISAIWGGQFENMNLILAGEYARRSKLQVKERDWALRAEEENPQGGWSNIGGPGRFLPVNPLAASAANPLGVIGGGPDPECENLGGAVVVANCRFQYTFFDNLTEKTDVYKLYGEANFDVSENANLRLEAAWMKTEIPEWNTSPSYPPQSLFGPDRRISADHPGLVDFVNQYYTDLPLPVAGAYTISRMAGTSGINGGQAEEGVIENEQYRFAAGLDGSLFDGELNYDVAVTYSERNRFGSVNDMEVEKMAFALDGLGGPGCDPATGTPGVGPCQYYNPFSNAIEVSAVTGYVNPNYNPDVANSDELIDWLVSPLITDSSYELLVFDAVFSGDTGWQLGGGTAGWAVGAQSRNEKFSFDISDNADLSLLPCPFNNPASITLGNTAAVGPDSCSAPTGIYAFTSGSNDTSTERTVYGVFGELALPLADNFDVQLALRFEDYGGNVGSTVDPKIAAKWQMSENWALRGSASTTFRGPPQQFLEGRATTLQFIAPTNAFKAVDTVGNPELDPETAIATNLGLLFDNGPARASLDYWRFDFSDPLQLESAGQIVSAYTGNGCNDGGAGVGTEICDSLRDRIFPFGTAGRGIERIERGWINGSDITTSGLDFYASYDFDLGEGNLTLGTEGTYTLEYESDDFLSAEGFVLASGGDFVGYHNEETPFQSLVEWQTNFFARYNRGPHNFSYTARYKSGYDDRVPPTNDVGRGFAPDAEGFGDVINDLDSIDSFLTHDVTYNLELFEGNTRLSASIYNLTDEDPPLAATDLNYDPYQHNPFGRMFKLGIVQQF